MAATPIIGRTTALVSLSAATEKTVYQLVSGSGQRTRVKGFSVSFTGTSPTEGPIQVFGYKTDGAGTLTASNPVVRDDALQAASFTPRATGGQNATIEPGSKVIVMGPYTVHPQQGYTEFSPQGYEVVIGSAAGTDGFAVACNAPAANSCHVSVIAEE